MKKLFSLAIAAAFIWSGCADDTIVSKDKNTAANGGLTLQMEAKPDWKYENLRLYPVLLSGMDQNIPTQINHFKSLAEAMQTPGFRILEKKQFGRQDDLWYNGLTVQNKTQDTVLLLSGEVVKGGNQDRVLAHHEVIMPMSVRNIEVYCVEAGRSSYYNPEAPAAEKQVAAFAGFYSIAAPQVRRAVQRNGSQQEVWNAVADVTKANNASSSTSAYTALDTENEQKKRRDAYQQHLEGIFAQNREVVGVVAVAGNQVLGVDVFGTPDLFRKHYPALLHGYIAGAAAMTDSGTALSDQQVQSNFDQVARMTAPHAKEDDMTGKFAWEGHWVHLFGK